MTVDFEKLRRKYLRLMPGGKIRWLMVAESPPSQRSETPYFFYYDGDDVDEIGGLFESTMMALYRDLWKRTVSSGKSYSDIKKAMLNRFSSDGFYLIDETNQMLSGLSLSEKRQALMGVKEGGLLLDQLEELAKQGHLTEDSRIVFVSALGYDLFFGYLRDKSVLGKSNVMHLRNLVVNERIPLPVRGNQAVYIKAIRSLCAETASATTAADQRVQPVGPTRPTAEPSKRTIATKPPINRIVVDGSNVACFQMGKGSADVTQLISTYRQLRTKYDFDHIRIIVGAGLRHKVGQESYDKLQRIFENEIEKRGSRIFYQAPARTSDDAYVITYAIEHDFLILTNDLYEDYNSAHPQHAKEVEKRLVKYMIMDGELTITEYPAY